MNVLIILSSDKNTICYSNDVLNNPYLPNCIKFVNEGIDCNINSKNNFWKECWVRRFFWLQIKQSNNFLSVIPWLFMRGSKFSSILAVSDHGIQWQNPLIYKNLHQNTTVLDPRHKNQTCFFNVIQTGCPDLISGQAVWTTKWTRSTFLNLLFKIKTIKMLLNSTRIYSNKITMK